MSSGRPLFKALINENPFQTTVKTSSSSPYLEFFPIYLPTTKVFVQTFFLKKYGSKIPYLPKVWTYVQSFVVFLFGTLSLLITQFIQRPDHKQYFKEWPRNLINRSIPFPSLSCQKGNFLLLCRQRYCHNPNSTSTQPQLNSTELGLTPGRLFFLPSCEPRQGQTVFLWKFVEVWPLRQLEIYPNLSIC